MLYLAEGERNTCALCVPLFSPLLDDKMTRFKEREEMKKGKKDLSDTGTKRRH